MDRPIYCVLDYETRSEADLKKVGAYEYSRHPSTQILCVSWKIGTKEELKQSSNPIEVWSPAIPSNYGSLKKALLNPKITLVAHNALFEQVITRNVLTRLIPDPDLKTIPISRWICTASLSSALALPRSLEGACLALALPIQKDMDGRKLLLKYCKPRKPTKQNSAKWNNSLTDLKSIMRYCQNDVDAEVQLFLKLPPLESFERTVWELDQKMNLGGFRVDRPLIQTALEMIREETDFLNDETLDETGLMSTNQRAEVLKWLESEGVFLKDLRAKTVRDAIEQGGVDGKAKRILQIRQAVSKTSTAKYQAFEQRSRSDGRVRDMMVYHGASTGRWSGSGVQPQNFPRGSVKDTDGAAEDLATGDREWVRMLHGDVMSVLSSCLRSMIIPSDGHEFVSADYATIEVRVLFWMAGHKRGLEMFESGEDIYRHMAAAIYNRNVAKIKNPSPERNLGKSAILGAGYGMGHKKFLLTCQEQGQEVTEDLAKLAITTYRTTHAPVVTFWNNMERAAIFAVQSWKDKNPKRIALNQTIWYVADGFLFCHLPSGRRLAYYQPEIRYEETPWGEPRPVLYHYGVNSLTKQWECSGTYGGRLVENVVQATARDVMANAMVGLDRLGYRVVLSVHDEILAEQPTGMDSVEFFEKQMATLPLWASGLPVEAKGWKGMRYKK